ncbi:hypothetical protein [Pantoea sp.]|uniref:hypothetical protein n=1 Tax=Pantoea sp. TaxID=69393 RepID=UPI0028AC6B6A|nr:hypothetical protein [Pantoea sp.]
MDLEKTIIATLAAAAGMPAFAGIISFVMWQNAFRVLGWKYIARLSLVLVLLVWINAAIPGPK